MRLRSCLAVMTGGIASAVLLFTGTASAICAPHVSLTGDRDMSCSAPAGASCFMPGPDNGLTATYSGPRMRTVHKVCLTFTFAGDLLDNGDALNVQVISGHSEPGFVQMGSSTSTRTLCLDSAYQPDLTSAFADGRQCLVFYMVTGSAYVTKVTATIS